MEQIVSSTGLSPKGILSMQGVTGEGSQVNNQVDNTGAGNSTSTTPLPVETTLPAPIGTSRRIVAAMQGNLNASNIPSSPPVNVKVTEQNTDRVEKGGLQLG